MRPLSAEGVLPHIPHSLKDTTLSLKDLTHSRNYITHPLKDDSCPAGPHPVRRRCLGIRGPTQPSGPPSRPQGGSGREPMDWKRRRTLPSAAVPSPRATKTNKSCPRRAARIFLSCQLCLRMPEHRLWYIAALLQNKCLS